MKQKTGIRVSDGAHLRALASAVIFQSVRDMINKRKPIQERLAAFLWLNSPDFEIWSDFAGAEINVYKLLPRLRQAEKQLKGR